MSWQPSAPGTLQRVGEMPKTLLLAAQPPCLKKTKPSSADKSSGQGGIRLGSAFPAPPVAWQPDVEHQGPGWGLFANIWLSITEHVVKAIQSLLKHTLCFMCRSVEMNGQAGAVSGVITAAPAC